MLSPTVSVLVPVYNGARFLGHALDSILSQTYEDIEIIVVDDNSTDESMDRALGFHDRRLRVVRNHETLGLAGNWNKCLSLAAGHYVTFLHQDDLMLPENIARKLESMKLGGFHIVASNCIQIDGKGDVIRNMFWAHPVASSVASRTRRAKFNKMFFGINYVCCPTMMFSRNVFTDVGYFDSRAGYCVDVHMWLRLLWRYDMCYLTDGLIKYRWAQNLSLGFTAADWYFEDFKARQLVADELGLPWRYRVFLRYQYAAGFASRYCKAKSKKENATAQVMLRGLKLALVGEPAANILPRS